MDIWRSVSFQVILLNLLFDDVGQHCPLLPEIPSSIYTLYFRFLYFNCLLFQWPESFERILLNIKLYDTIHIPTYKSKFQQSSHHITSLIRFSILPSFIHNSRLSLAVLGTIFFFRHQSFTCYTKYKYILIVFFSIVQILLKAFYWILNYMLQFILPIITQTPVIVTPYLFSNLIFDTSLLFIISLGFPEYS